VDGVTKITELTAGRHTRTKGRQAETLRKMILAMASDIRVLLIKLADRLHNMRTLGYLPESKQQRIAAGNPGYLRAHGPPPGHPALGGRAGRLVVLLPGA
jgi:(p)ppGpp synthase/HD superfamily hydrolase